MREVAASQVRKGVELTHRGVLGQVDRYARAIDLRGDDRIVSWLPLYHDMGLIACLTLPLVTAVPACVMSPFDWLARPELLLEAVTAERSTLAWMPNFAFHLMADRVRLDPERPLDLSSLRAVVNCSEPVDPVGWRRFHELLAPCGLSPFAGATCYAMAENVFAVTQGGIGGPVAVDHVDARVLRADGIAVAVCDPTVETAEVPSSGRALADAAVEVIGADGRALPDRTVGEIRLRGPCLAGGYRDDAEATAAAFGEDGYRTGDLGYLADGELYVLGRSDDVILVAGQNVHPGEIELAAGRVRGVRPGRVVAFGTEAPRTGTQRVVVVAEADDGVAAAPERAPEVVRRLRRDVREATHVGVSEVLVVAPGTLRKSAAGKLSRALMRDLYRLGAVAPLSRPGA
jgi:fatty-acyl-CoA synthase